MAFPFAFQPFLDISSAHEDNLRITTTDQFLVEYGGKVDELRHILWNNINLSKGKHSLEGLNLVDAVLRLGIEYHFKVEIEAILQREYLIFINNSNFGDSYMDQDLHEVALRFRLLRQGGYDVSADVFNKFKDPHERKFNLALVEDIEGLMAMFEASQISLEEEEILEEAEYFSRRHLSAMSNKSQINVENTLKQPYHKSLSRLTATNFLKSCEATNDVHWITVLQEVTIKDFKIVQLIHKNEIAKISKWWKELGLAKELKFARNQPLKWYLWTVASLSDPNLSEQRIDLTKPISLVYIIDDIFDVYGTLDELTLFTQAVNIWEITLAEQILPDYMKICFNALYDITNEIADKVYQKHGWNPIDSLKKSWAKLCNAFLVEAQWLVSGDLPNEEEYMKNAIVSSGVHVVLVHMFFLLGQGITEDVVDQLDHMPGLISSTATILRLWDDLGNAKDEDQSGQDGSYIECYMKSHVDGSVEEARDHVINMINTEWKRLNKECLNAKPFPLCFKKACLNAARMVPAMYDYDENQRLPGLQDYMKSLLL